MLLWRKLLSCNMGPPPNVMCLKLFEKLLRYILYVDKYVIQYRFFKYFHICKFY